jgi:tRNA(Ile)-lysidine synthase
VAAWQRLVEQVRRCLTALGEGAPGLVVAVSGGPDSVALTRAVAAARRPGAAAPLVLAHLNHQLRGAESDADEDFVAALHAELVSAGVPSVQLCRHRIDVAAKARAEGANVEAVARQLRYRWLAGVARDHGVSWVATGHTADDQAETVLHRLLRGTGLQGLRGIAARRRLETGVGVMRPLLRTTRAEVLAALVAWGQPYRVDSSNSDPRYTRNRIRQELLPHLAERYNPAVVAALARLADQAGEAHRAETKAAAALLAAAELPRAGSLVVLDRVRLAAASRRLVRAAFRRVWRREGWPLARMGQAAWERLADLVFGDVPAVDLPGGVHARRRERVVQVGNHDVV